MKCPIPPAYRGRLIGDQGAAEWNEFEISSQDDAAGATLKVSEKLLSEINTHLQDRSSDVHLDFGAYGRYCDRRPRSQRTHNQGCRLPCGGK